MADKQPARHSSGDSDRVAIIGAGPAGLATARALKALEIPFDVYEKHKDVGGIWNADNPGSPMYRSAHFISSKTQSGHLGFPMPDEYPDYPANQQILAYIRNFAEYFGLSEHIRFEHTVIEVSKEDNSWRVHYRNARGDTETSRYRWLVCANGTNWHPNKPTLEGQDSFQGTLMHSVEYQDARQLENKRVLVVGAGNSGVDIACDAAFSAKQAYISLRRGYHFVPKHVFGQPADVFGSRSKWLPISLQQRIFGTLLRILEGDLTRLGLQKPDHKIFSSHPILNTQILHYLQHGDLVAKPDIARLDGKLAIFEDGSQEEIDLVILATGYRWQLPYLPEGIFDYRNGRPTTYLKVFNRKDTSLFINGFIETDGGAYKLFDEMACLIAQAIRDQQISPSAAARLERQLRKPEPALGGKVQYLDSDRHTGYTRSLNYRKAMARFIREMHWETPEQILLGRLPAMQNTSAKKSA